MKNTNEFFVGGKLSVVLDGGAGSSGKGKIGAFLVANSDKVGFVCNTFMPNASHTIVEKDENGETKSYVYKSLNSCAHNHSKFEKMYIGQGSVIHLPSLLKEIQMAELPNAKLGISPIAMVVQEGLDDAYERGEMDLEGNVYEEKGDGTIKTGTTASGSGACRARKLLRKGNALLARDVPELKPYICDVELEIMDRLDKGQAGLLEIAQGFQLSYGLPQFYPYTTSRNCTVAAGFDDMMLPTVYLGNVLLNFRTYPIRIHSYKYIATKVEPVETVHLENEVSDEDIKKQITTLERKYDNHKVELVMGISDADSPVEAVEAEGGEEVAVGSKRIVVTPIGLPEGTHLTWEQVQDGIIPHERIDSYSGEFYEDQTEIDWEQLTIKSGALEPIMECTTLTKLPRRVATFSPQNVADAVKYNQSPFKVFISVNFVNYVDVNMYGRNDMVTEKVAAWIEKYISPVMATIPQKNVVLKYLGTSEYTDDTVVLAQGNM